MEVLYHEVAVPHCVSSQASFFFVPPELCRWSTKRVDRDQLQPDFLREGGIVKMGASSLGPNRLNSCPEESVRRR